MYGQQVGKLEQPLENIVVEEFQGESNRRQVLVTISMKDFPATKPIAEQVAQFAAANSEIGSLFVDEPSSPLKFQRSFDNYLAQIAKLGPGQVLPVVDYEFLKIHFTIRPTAVSDLNTYFVRVTLSPHLNKPSVNCLATNRFANPNAQLELWYSLAGHYCTENSFSVSQLKNIGHPQIKLGAQGVIGYLLIGTDAVIDRTKNEIVGLAREQPATQRGILTLNDVAYMKEALSEFRYQAMKPHGPQGNESAIPHLSRGPKILQ